MARILGISGKYILASGLALAVFVPLTSAQAFGVLHSFAGGSDGSEPIAGLIHNAGNLYGTTYLGGTGCGGNGCGTVFELARDGTETVLHAFTGGIDGGAPAAGLIADNAGNLYGATLQGGKLGYGTIFELAPNGAETVLHYFKGQGKGDGAQPYASLIADNAGNLYGTTEAGGIACSYSYDGCGTVYKVALDGKKSVLSVLYAFTGGSDGGVPYAGVIADKKGNLYGTTVVGGSNSCTGGCGTVFGLKPDGTETVLHAFSGGTDGSEPIGGLIADAASNLYGTTAVGGASGAGTVFKIAPDGTETILYTFTGGSDGGIPVAGLIADTAGNLYGNTERGGRTGPGCGGNGCGTIFKLAPDGAETVLYAFCAKQAKHYCRDGSGPQSGLIVDKKGSVYGTTFGGGAQRRGTVFRFKAGIVFNASAETAPPGGPQTQR